MNLRSSHLANFGARIARVPPQYARGSATPDRAAASPDTPQPVGEAALPSMLASLAPQDEVLKLRRRDPPCHPFLGGRGDRPAGALR